MAACGDAVLAFESVVEAGTNAMEKHIQLACQLLSAAMFNSSTNTVASTHITTTKVRKEFPELNCHQSEVPSG